LFSRRAGQASLLLLLGAVSAARAQSLDLPAGPVQAKVRTACTECHDASIIQQQRLSEKVWTKELDKMTKWGALVDPADRGAFIEYLSVNFPPDKPPVPIAHVARRKKQ
jgi:hypothetical protein